MSKVTSKLQVTIPKRVAEAYGIEPGDEVDWVPAGEAIRMVPAGRETPGSDVSDRLELFDRASARQRRREALRPCRKEPPADRRWRREELYVRDGSD